MKILLAFNGNRSLFSVHKSEELLEDIFHFPTTHMSEVNSLLIAYWLEKLGHDVSFLVRSTSTTDGLHFKPVSITSLRPRDYDVLFIFKVHGLKLCEEIIKQPWKRIVAWLDSPNPQNILGDYALRISTFFWGTPEIAELETPRWPKAEHVVCEHATALAVRPQICSAIPRGLYAGRLPVVYRDQLIAAAAGCHMLAYGLWLDTGTDRVLLRPGQCTSIDLEWAQRSLPETIELRPGANMLQEANCATACAFGLCPSAGNASKQLLSASKFYDYAALGLPVLLAQNTPEAEHVRKQPYLGMLYDPSDSDAIANAAATLAQDIKESGFAERRVAIQDWCYAGHTYRDRAEVINAELTK